MLPRPRRGKVLFFEPTRGHAPAVRHPDVDVEIPRHRGCRPRLGTTFLLTLWLAVPAAGQAGAERPEPALPTASALMARVLERSARVARNTNAAPHTCLKRALVEELDGKGRVVKTTEKTYRVQCVQGIPFSRLIKVGGRELSPAELRKQDLREQAFLKKIAARDPDTMARGKEAWVTRELVDRYEFKVQGREPFENRMMVVLEFVPRASQPAAHKPQDRILERLTGRLWVDEADAEVARLEVRLLEAFSLGWLGLVGSVKQCDLLLLRQRLADGCWVNRRQTLVLGGRKLTSALRYRTTEDSSGWL